MLVAHLISLLSHLVSLLAFTFLAHWVVWAVCRGVLWDSYRNWRLSGGGPSISWWTAGVWKFSKGKSDKKYNERDEVNFSSLFFQQVVSRTDQLLKSASDLEELPYVSATVKELANKINGLISGFQSRLNTRKKTLDTASRLHTIMEKVSRTLGLRSYCSEFRQQDICVCVCVCVCCAYSVNGLYVK